MRFKIETGNNNPILRSKSTPIDKNEYKKYSLLGEDMVKFIKDPDNNGVGIAAPQIGFNKRLIAVSLLKTYDDKSFKTIFMINPEIIDYAYDFEVDNEGCLSVPKKFGDVARSKSIKVRYYDSKGKENILMLTSIAARIVQHEIDHLDGILFIDKIVEKEDHPFKNHVL